MTMTFISNETENVSFLYCSIRGRLGSLLMLAANAGFLIAFLAGYYLNYHTIPCIGIGISIVYMLGISFFPETPTYLLRHKKNGVTKTLYFYCNQTFSIEV